LNDIYVFDACALIALLYKKNGENIMVMTKVTSTEMRKYTKKKQE